MGSLKRQSDLLKILSNPGKILKDLERLTKKEESVRSLLKDLYEGKGKKEALEEMDKLTESAKVRLAQIEKGCKDKMEAVDKERKAASYKFEKSAKKLKDMAKHANEAVEEAKERIDAAEKKELAVKKMEDAAALLYREAEKKKEIYEDKMKDLNERFKGLVE
jgi:chromosome segregation ATPase